MKNSVYINDVETDKPVYHTETTEEMQGPYGKVHRAVTGCGKSTSFVSTTLRIRRDWADKFAKPCRECFPNAPKTIEVNVHMDER